MEIPRQNLRTPGPTPVPEDIVQAMSQPMINHRGPEFLELVNEVTDKLKQVFMTQVTGKSKAWRRYNLTTPKLYFRA